MPGYRAVPRGGDLAGHGDSGGGSARPALPGSRYWREDSPVRAGVAVKLAGRQAPGGSPCLHWLPTSIPAPPPSRHRVHGSLRITPRDSGVPGGVQCQGQGRLGPQGVGAQESSPLRSAAGTQRSFRLGRPSGPREPGSRWWGGVPALGGGDPALGERSPPTSPSPALPQTRPLYRSSPSPRNMGGGENHSPGLRGDDPRVSGRGVIPHWGLVSGNSGVRALWERQVV